MRVAVVWWARRQRRCISPLRFFLFCRGIPLAAGAPAAGAQSSPEGRPFEPRPRLCSSDALVSLVPLDFTSSRQTCSAPDHQHQMARHRQNRLLPAVRVIWPQKHDKTFFYESSESESAFFCISSPPGYLNGPYFKGTARMHHGNPAVLIPQRYKL